MPYLRMFISEQQLDEVFISDVFTDSVLGNHFIQEEKQRMLDKHDVTIKKIGTLPYFDLDPPMVKIG
jgi:hypothetical protein